MTRTMWFQWIAIVCAGAAMTIALARPVFTVAAQKSPNSSEKQEESALPMITAEGIRLTLLTRTHVVSDGSKALFEVKCENLTDHSIKATATMSMSGIKVEPLSRIGPMPRQVWSGDVPLAMAPGETTICHVEADVAGIHGQISAQLTFDGQTVRSAPMSAEHMAKLLQSASLTPVQ